MATSVFAILVATIPVSIIPVPTTLVLITLISTISVLVILIPAIPVSATMDLTTTDISCPTLITLA